MNSAISHRMLSKLRKSMNITSLPLHEQWKCETKLKLTKKIDHILYTEWNPLGVHFLKNCDDEYHSYLPGIVNLVFEGAPIVDVADALFELDEMLSSPTHSRRRCDVIAAMVSRYGPHADKNPFLVVINTGSPESAYQSVLDLVTQTRIDVYENNWIDVRDNYERAVTCSYYLRVLTVESIRTSRGMPKQS